MSITAPAAGRLETQASNSFSSSVVIVMVISLLTLKQWTVPPAANSFFTITAVNKIEMPIDGAVARAGARRLQEI